MCGVSLHMTGNNSKSLQGGSSCWQLTNERQIQVQNLKGLTLQWEVVFWAMLWQRQLKGWRATLANWGVSEPTRGQQMNHVGHRMGAKHHLCSGLSTAQRGLSPTYWLTLTMSVKYFWCGKEVHWKTRLICCRANNYKQFSEQWPDRDRSKQLPLSFFSNYSPASSNKNTGATLSGPPNAR